MSATEILEQIRKMPEAERRELVERIENEFAVSNDELTPEEISEIDRRVENARAHPEECRPLEAVLADIEKRFRSKG